MRIRQEELDDLRAAGVPVQKNGDEWTFRQPCTMYRQAACAIHSSRPHACRTYECELLKACESGAITLDAAEQHVRRAKALREAVMEGLPPGETIAQFWPVRARDEDTGTESTAPADARPADPRWLLALNVLRRHLDRYFEPPRSEK